MCILGANDRGVTPTRESRAAPTTASFGWSVILIYIHSVANAFIQMSLFCNFDRELPLRCPYHAQDAPGKSTDIIDIRVISMIKLTLHAKISWLTATYKRALLPRSR